MTPDEFQARMAIRDTLARYNIAGDRIRGEDFAAVFTDDAVFQSDGGGRDIIWRYEGAAQIREWIDAWTKVRAGDPLAAGGKMGATATPKRSARFVRHHQSTCLIDLTGPETARTRTYWAVYTDIGPDHGGYYKDEFRKTRDRWLIAHRHVHTDWRAPDSFFKPA